MPRSTPLISCGSATCAVRWRLRAPSRFATASLSPTPELALHASRRAGFLWRVRYYHSRVCGTVRDGGHIRMNHFVFVESNTTGTGQIAIQKLLARGDQVTFLTRNPAKYPFLDLVGPEIKVKELDTNDLPGVLQAVHKIQAKQHVDAVLTFSDFYVSIVTELAAALGLPGLHPMAAQACRYKPATRRTLRDAGLLTPEFHLVVSKEEALELANKISYPCVLKTTCDSSSHGVGLVRGPREFLEHYNALHAWKENVRGDRK